MNENMKLWNAVKQPPASALKTIQAGRLKGKTDISPQWRLQVMTEQFGPCGNGWSYKIDDLWTEPGVDGQVFAFALVSVQIGSQAPVPGIGGSMLIAKGSSGLHHNDEAFKMAVTDALSVALKALGVAADIYLGLWDGSKYREPIKPESAKSVPQDVLETLEKKVPGSTEFLQGIAADTVALLDEDRSWDAKCFIEGKRLEADEKTALWALFNSKQRSALKAAVAPEEFANTP